MTKIIGLAQVKGGACRGRGAKHPPQEIGTCKRPTLPRNWRVA
jgi:hypothetical protein